LVNFHKFGANFFIMPGFELFGAEERKELQDVLDNGVLMRYGFDAMRNGHWKAKEFEGLIKEKFEAKHAQLTTSGTTALNLALSVLGIGFGDEVIVPSFTFVASFEAILLAGAIPVFVDIDESLTLDPIAVEKAITPKTKAIMVVHMCGAMANMDALMEISNKHNIKLVEDACQAIGGGYKGKMLGSIGHAGCFSFDYVKTITCGEGGAVITNDEKLAILADNFTDHGHDHIGNDRGAETHPFVGYNYRQSELHAAVGVAQIKKLDKILAIQRKNKQIIKSILSQIAGLKFRLIHDEAGDNASFLSFFMPTIEQNNQLVLEFKANGIGDFWNYYENNWHYIKNWHHLKEAKFLYPISKEIKEGLDKLKNQSFAQSDNIMGRNISTLIKLSWTEEQVIERANKMADAIKKVLL
jgi:8-amino-3,8-dideoxy-alpha-D-manno-octulosonate transaminase